MPAIVLIRHDEANAGGIPFTFGQQIHREVRPKRVTHVSQEEIGSVKRAARARQFTLSATKCDH
jgi:hypothetical protein